MLWRFFITTSLFVAGDMPLVRKCFADCQELTMICWGGQSDASTTLTNGHVPKLDPNHQTQWFSSQNISTRFALVNATVFIFGRMGQQPNTSVTKVELHVHRAFGCWHLQLGRKGQVFEQAMIMSRIFSSYFPQLMFISTVYIDNYDINSMSYIDNYDILCIQTIMLISTKQVNSCHVSAVYGGPPALHCARLWRSFSRCFCRAWC